MFDIDAQLAGCQEELVKALEKIKEQVEERVALKHEAVMYHVHSIYAQPRFGLEAV